jgi:hypothetical protein
MGNDVYGRVVAHFQVVYSPKIRLKVRLESQSEKSVSGQSFKPGISRISIARPRDYIHYQKAYEFITNHKGFKCLQIKLSRVAYFATLTIADTEMSQMCHASDYHNSSDSAAASRVYICSYFGCSIQLQPKKTGVEF